MGNKELSNEVSESMSDNRYSIGSFGRFTAVCQTTSGNQNATEDADLRCQSRPEVNHAESDEGTDTHAGDVAPGLASRPGALSGGLLEADDLVEYTPGPGAPGAARALGERPGDRLEAPDRRPVIIKLRTRAELEAVIAVWRAVVSAGAYADVAAAIAGELQQELTTERAEQLVYCLNKLHEATTSALVVTRAELRDQLHPCQLQLPVSREVG